MNKIDLLFSQKDKNILNVYCTAGYPHLTDTSLIISALQKAGADMIEIGIPFSDPVADGPVIQQSSHRALKNGMNLDILFDQLQEQVKERKIPMILMGYYNTVYQYGMERFIQQCSASGIDGIILPDLPPEVYEEEYAQLFMSHNIHFICLVSPDTAPERVDYLQRVSRGFIYLLSQSSTTGRNESQFHTFNYSASFSWSLPTLMGFGIHNQQTFEAACKVANGAIIGSQFIRETGTIGEAEENRAIAIEELCRNFIKSIKG